MATTDGKDNGREWQMQKPRKPQHFGGCVLLYYACSRESNDEAAGPAIEPLQGFG
ncbi:MAG TPA: hypothetical protein VF268_11455 [Gammaproteobacteria bacterium]